jgi:hypothetical protein
MPKARARKLRTEFLGVIGIGKLEKSQARAVADVEEAVGVGSYLAEQVGLFSPGGHEFESDDLLVKLSDRFQVFANVSIVVQRTFNRGYSIHRNLLLNRC